MNNKLIILAIIICIGGFVLSMIKLNPQTKINLSNAILNKRIDSIKQFTKNKYEIFVNRFKVVVQLIPTIPYRQNADTIIRIFNQFNLEVGYSSMPKKLILTKLKIK